jgi:hypothetical protein
MQKCTNIFASVVIPDTFYSIYFLIYYIIHLPVAVHVQSFSYLMVFSFIPSPTADNCLIYYQF